MSVPVTVLDYGIGNLLNVVRALEHCGAAVTIVDKAAPEQISASRLVLPGVGAFGDGMTELRARGFDEFVQRFDETGRPFLGICVGMQMMFYASEEAGLRDVEAELTARHPWCAALGVRFPCSVESVKAAYRRLARTTHPDAGGDPAAFRAVEAAYRAALTCFAREGDAPP